ncbi:hypothetical protein [Enhygromyxa salina]|uniref:Ubiquinone biosynthesis protein n=1 Tax=Enhygromyxa salina TaxID=215803 RepID=A0A2S9YYK3_9BACT|nr:hypothetical protein [Enhygromyxa salina]PRQ10157.1 hypothetical protein ENSA7_01060 [Enhygromyxa salina]
MATADHYDLDATLLDARTQYFERNGFGADGGYSAKTVTVEVAGIKLRIPNTPGRVHAVRYHDLHHIMTGYTTHMSGESEIGAWELASNCRDLYAAWVLNGAAFAFGLISCPRRVRAAFIRGCHTRNLYDRDFNDILLNRRVGELRAELGLERDSLEQPLAATIGDRLAFVGAAVICLGVPLAVLCGVIFGVLVLLR